MADKLVFVWDNLGPTHVDRCRAVATSHVNSYEVVALELSARSSVYEWKPDTDDSFKKITIAHEKGFEDLSFFMKVFLLARFCFRQRPGAFFFCHYEKPAIFVTAILLRVFGSRVFIMNDSKFDDYERTFLREHIKRIMYKPYSGALVAADRSRDYMRFLGFGRDRIHIGYDSISIDRVRRSVGITAISINESEITFRERPFIIISRLVPKKNIKTALEAYALYLAQCGKFSRKLIICGSGILESELRKQCGDLKILQYVEFCGFLQSIDVMSRLRDSLALILKSTEEQFGLAIAEAQSLEIPVIVTQNCGACDQLVRTGVNGFVVEPDNPLGCATFMLSLHHDEKLWQRMRAASRIFAERGDVRHFVTSVEALLANKNSDEN